MPRGRPRKVKPQETGNGGEPVPGIGHNMAGLSAEQILEATREIESEERKKDETVGSLRSVRKRWKDRGLDLRVFDAIRKLRKFTIPELTVEFNHRVAYGKALHIPIYSQLEMFSGQSEMSDEDRLAEARARGLVAGKSGAERLSPYPLETPAGRVWAEAFDEAVRGRAA